MVVNVTQTDVNVKSDSNDKDIITSTNSKKFSGSLQNQHSFNF